MFRVKVEEAPVAATSAKTGLAYRTQKIYVFLIGADGREEAYPRPVVAFVGEKETGWAKGEYTLGAGSVRVGQGDRLEFGRLQLTPKVAATSRAA